MRASGILMGISSIPSKYGIGCFSKEAYDFVDQLEKAGQQYWDRLGMEILRISLFLHLQGIHILLIWRN